MNYSDYFKRMSAIENALNSVNLTQCAPVSDASSSGERIIEAMGRYLYTITGAIADTVGHRKALYYSAQFNRSLPHIIQLFRDQKCGAFSFGLVEPDQWDEIVQSDRDVESNWHREMRAYQSMTPNVFLGASCCRVPIDTLDPADVADWCCNQAAHLAKYCVCNNIYLVELIYKL